MTTLYPAPPRPALRITWTQVDHDLWTASKMGEFIGTVRRVRPGRFVAVDGYGGELGSASALADAKELVQRGRVLLGPGD